MSIVATINVTLNRRAIKSKLMLLLFSNDTEISDCSGSVHCLQGNYTLFLNYILTKLALRDSSKRKP